MNGYLVFGVLTIVFVFHYVSADVQPLTLQDVDKAQIKPITDSREATLPKRFKRTLGKGKGGYSKGSGYCNTCGYQQQSPQYYPRGSCNTCGGGGGGGGSWSNSQSSSSSGSWGNGKKK